MSFWTPERIEELRTRRAAGETRAQIGVAMGTTKMAVKQAIRSYGISGHQENPDTEQAVIELRNQGHTGVMVLAELLGIDRRTIARILRKNIGTAPPKALHTGRRASDPEMLARVVALRDAGLQHKEVAAELGIPISRAKVYARLGGGLAGVVPKKLRPPPRPREPRMPGPPAHVHRRPKPRAPRINMGGDPPKEAGHFVTWNAITAGTSMAGEPFPGWA